MKKILIAFACLVFVVAALFAIRSRPVHELKKEGNTGQVPGDSESGKSSSDMEEAVADFGAVQPGRTGAKGYYNHALSEQIDGKLDEAMGDYNRAIGLDPGFAEAWDNRGVVRQAKGDLDGAAADFNHAITLDPKSARAFNNRGVVKQARGDIEGAIADFTSAITLDPKYGKAYNNRGYAREAKGDSEEAASDHNRAIGLIPKRAGTGTIGAEP
jgi:tetratricopeptide (TPR) repeat protein